MHIPLTKFSVALVTFLACVGVTVWYMRHIEQNIINNVADAQTAVQLRATCGQWTVSVLEGTTTGTFICPNHK